MPLRFFGVTMDYSKKLRKQKALEDAKKKADAEALETESEILEEVTEQETPENEVLEESKAEQEEVIAEVEGSRHENEAELEE